MGEWLYSLSKCFSPRHFLRHRSLWKYLCWAIVYINNWLKIHYKTQGTMWGIVIHQSWFSTNNEKRRCTYIFVYDPTAHAKVFHTMQERFLPVQIQEPFIHVLYYHKQCSWLISYFPPWGNVSNSIIHNATAIRTCLHWHNMGLLASAGSSFHLLNAGYIITPDAAGLWMPASNGSIKGCYCASRMTVTPAGPIQSRQENVNKNSSSRYVKCAVLNFTA